MEALLDKARKFLEDNPGFNEVELGDAHLWVRVIRNSPTIINSHPYLYPSDTPYNPPVIPTPFQPDINWRT